MIVQSHNELMRRYQELKSGDVVRCRVISKNLRSVILLDLLERGVRCFPAALSQILNGSKVAQGLLLSEWMMPHTKPIQRRAGLMNAVRHYRKNGIRRVVTKEDKMHCGYGVRIWDHVEMLYSCVGLSRDFFPFLLQPFLENLTDIRVIIAGDYVEAMWMMLQHNEPDDYVVATGKNYSVREFLSTVFSYLDLDWEKYVETDPRYFRPTEVDELMGNPEKAMKKLSWRPRVDFDGLVEMMIECDMELARQEKTLREAGHLANAKCFE